MSERERVEAGAPWYISEQLDIDVAVLNHRYQAVKPHLRGRRGLELGPADGHMTAQLLGHFQELTIVDAAPELLACIPEAPGLTKVVSLFEDFVPGQPFDAIVADHVLEHVEDPASLLRSARNWLSPGGVLIAGVPNSESLHRLVAVKMGLLSHPKELNERDIALGHRRVYDPETLQAEVREAGFEVAYFGGVFVKPLSNAQIQATWTPAMIDAFAGLGADMPQLAAEIFVVCR